MVHGCGCCGREISETALWCRDCQSHISERGNLYDQTYFAQHGAPCPFAALDSATSEGGTA